MFSLTSHENNFNDVQLEEYQIIFRVFLLFCRPYWSILNFKKHTGIFSKTAFGECGIPKKITMAFLRKNVWWPMNHIGSKVREEEKTLSISGIKQKL